LIRHNEEAPGAPAGSAVRSGSVTELVRSQYDSILAQYGRGARGKSWAVLGKELRPASPIPPDTLSKAVRREAKRRGLAEAPPVSARRASKRTSTDQAPPSAPAPELTMPVPNPFVRRIDPFCFDDE
jgi:hypothetical protein